MTTANLNIRVDENLKNQAQAVFESYGLSVTQVFKMFLNQVVKTGAIPLSLDYNASERNYRPEVIKEILQSKNEVGQTFQSNDELVEWLKRS